jgi:hypothetical protein
MAWLHGVWGVCSITYSLALKREPLARFWGFVEFVELFCMGMLRVLGSLMRFTRWEDNDMIYVLNAWIGLLENTMEQFRIDHDLNANSRCCNAEISILVKYVTPWIDFLGSELNILSSSSQQRKQPSIHNALPTPNKTSITTTSASPPTKAPVQSAFLYAQCSALDPLAACSPSTTCFLRGLFIRSSQAPHRSMGAV